MGAHSQSVANTGAARIRSLAKGLVWTTVNCRECVGDGVGVRVLGVGVRELLHQYSMSAAMMGIPRAARKPFNGNAHLAHLLPEGEWKSTQRKLS